MSFFQNKRRKGFNGEMISSNQSPFLVYHDHQTNADHNKIEQLISEQRSLVSQLNTQNLLIQELHRQVEQLRNRLDQMEKTPSECWDQVPSYIN